MVPVRGLGEGWGGALEEARLAVGCFSPNGAIQGSPGHRPGDVGSTKQKALKGRIRILGWRVDGTGMDVSSRVDPSLAAWGHAAYSRASGNWELGSGNSASTASSRRLLRLNRSKILKLKSSNFADYLSRIHAVKISRRGAEPQRATGNLKRGQP